MSDTTHRSGGDSGSASPPGDAERLTPRSGRVKEARKLQRRSVREERGLFLVEGAKSIAEALTVPGCVREVYAAASADPAAGPVLHDARAQGVPVRACDDAAIAALADTVTPQGLVAVCALIAETATPGEVGARVSADGARLVVVCADVRDPGNAGTVIRCADAAGADAVVLAGSSVDPHNPKTVRATVGSLFHLPILRAGEPAEVVSALRAAGMQVLAADGAGEVDLDDAADDGTLTAPTAWLMGNEAWGLPDDLAAAATARIAIPIHGRAESLNLATAAAVCLYASARAQRAARRGRSAG